MVLNVSAKDYSVTVDGVDISTAIKTIDGNYGHYEQGSGKILIDAKIVIGKALGFAESLDERFNPLWQRGKKIIVEIAGERCPVLGTLYILEAKWDGLYTLELTCGCLLSLLNFRTPQGDQICVNFIGDVFDREFIYLSAILAKIFAKLKIPPNLIDYSGISVASDYKLNIPPEKLSTDSYVDVLGKIVWHLGRVVYQDKFGVIKFKQIDASQDWTYTNPYYMIYSYNQVGGGNVGSNVSNAITDLKVGQDDIKYERLTASQYPFENVRAVATLKQFLRLSDRRNGVNGNTAFMDSRALGSSVLSEFEYAKIGSVPDSFMGILMSPSSGEITETYGVQALVNSSSYGLIKKTVNFPQGIASWGQGKQRGTIEAVMELEMKGSIASYFPNTYQLVPSLLNITRKQFEDMPYQQINSDRCESLDEARVLVEVIYTYKPLATVLSKFLENTGINFTESFSLVRDFIDKLIIEKIEIKKYEYKDKSVKDPLTYDPTSGYNNLYNQKQETRVEVITQVWQPAGILYNKFVQPYNSTVSLDQNTTAVMAIATALNSAYGGYLGQPRLVEETKEVWNNTGKNEWEYTKLTSQAFAQILSDKLEQLEATEGTITTIDTYHALISSATETKKSASGSTNPPNPDRFPTAETKEDQIVYVAKFPSYVGKTYREREKKIDLDTTYTFNQIPQMKNLAELEGKLIVGRYKGISCTTKFIPIIAESPLTEVTWEDFYGTKCSYLVDGISIAFSNRRLAMSFDGILWAALKTQNVNYGSGIFFTDLNGNEDTFVGTIIFSGVIVDYPYEITTVNDALNGEMAFSGYLQETITLIDDPFIKKAILFGIITPSSQVNIPVITNTYYWDAITEDEWSSISDLEWLTIESTPDIYSWLILNDLEWDNINNASWLLLNE